MQIVATSVHIIDFENGQTRVIAPPAAFKDYVAELVTYVNDNTTIREFTTVSRKTEVIGCVLDIKSHADNSENIQENTNTIADRLLLKETAAQERIEHLDIRVQKGSLIQALLKDEESDTFTYLLAKVEHGGFVDDADFSFKSGFSKDKKTIWKTCIFDLSSTEPQKIPAKVYSNTAAKYWWDDFLELVAVTNDERNTENAFKAVDSTLNRIVKEMAPFDHTIIRNTFVSYFKNHEHLDYNQMIHDVMDNYAPTDLPQEKLHSLRDRLLELPDDRHFDRQFTPVPSVIKARIKKVYDIYQGVKLQITDEIANIEDVISAERETDGSQYIKIKTTDSTTFKRFYKHSKN